MNVPKDFCKSIKIPQPTLPISRVLSIFSDKLINACSVEYGRLFAISHQELRCLDFALKVLYQLISGQKIWSEANRTVKSKVADARVVAVTHIKATCGGLLVDSPNAIAGSTNTGPVAKGFFHESNREAICRLIDVAEDRENYKIPLSQLSICLAVAESVDGAKTENIDKVMQYSFDTMIHIALHFHLV